MSTLSEYHKMALIRYVRERPAIWSNDSVPDKTLFNEFKCQYMSSANLVKSWSRMKNYFKIIVTNRWNRTKGNNVNFQNTGWQYFDEMAFLLPSLLEKLRQKNAAKNNVRTPEAVQKEDCVFSNQDVNLKEIEYYGFDLDFTLAQYNAGELAQSTFELLRTRLIEIGYPNAINECKFLQNHFTMVKGVAFDSSYGNFLQLNAEGRIIRAWRSKSLDKLTMEAYYPDAFISMPNRERLYFANTSFDGPEMQMICHLIQYFDESADYELTADRAGYRNESMNLSFINILMAVRRAMGHIHMAGGPLKQQIVNNLAQFFIKDKRIIQLLQQLKEGGKRIFLVTNSDASFTNAVMNYQIGANWRGFFDCINVNAQKPSWFECDRNELREILANGKTSIGSVVGPLRKGAIYSEGNWVIFQRLMGATARNTLYIGDHLFTDILKAKKKQGIRTFFVIPEMFGDAGLFKYGNQKTLFSSQIERFADLYAVSCSKILNYGLGHVFKKANSQIMAHDTEKLETEEDEDRPGTSGQHR